MEMELPWPPSVNTYYRHVGGRVLLSTDGRKYKNLVREHAILSGWHMLALAEPCRLIVTLEHPRILSFDADNRLKAIQDSMQGAGILADDKWIVTVSAEKVQASSKRCFITVQWPYKIKVKP